MKRIFLAAVFQLLAAAAIIISLQPCLALFAGASQERQGYYEHVYWNYLVIRSWLAALAGITSLRPLIPEHQLVTAIAWVVLGLGFCNQCCQRGLLKCVHAQNL